MSGGKETPRQKMIGMMYLVLTALLALNVSKDILDSFVTVNSGLEKTNVNFEQKNGSLYNQFNAALQENEAKVRPFFTQAEEVRIATEKLVSYVDQVKAKVMSATDGKTLEQVIGKGPNGRDTILNLKYIDSKDNYDIPTDKLGLSEPGKPKGGELTALELHENLEIYRDLLLAKVKGNAILEKSLNETFNFEKTKAKDGTPELWEAKNFYHSPLAAVVTILSKIQSEVLNSEADVVKTLLSNVDAASFKFNKLEAAVIPVSSYVTQGDSFRADIFLAAFDTTQNPTIILGTKWDSITKTMSDSFHVNVVNGKGIFRVPASSVGEKEYEGVIEFIAPGGGTNYYNFPLNYTVAAPALVVAPTKMNVFYVGVQNPVSISVPGFSAASLTTSLEGAGSIVKDPKGKSGDYLVTVKSGKQCFINVTAKMPNGSNKSMGKAEFRVKDLPDPEPLFAKGRKGDVKIDLRDAKAASAVFAEMKDFLFDLKFDVVGFDLYGKKGSQLSTTYKSRNNVLTPEMKEIISGLNRGDKLWIENVKAKGPDGRTRSIGGLSFKVM
jgi:gliding motility-associated protein GldM